jgi:hypothetical protein
MTTNYFAVEHNGICAEHVVITNDNGEIMFEDLMNMSYDEMKSYDEIDAFVATVMEISEAQFGIGDDPETVVTLVDKDGFFIWGIIMGPGEGDEIRYSLVDWKKHGKSFKYIDDEEISEN